MLKYLSPTSVNMALTDPNQFYIQYLSDSHPREPQTRAMSIGSAFDAYVKAYLHGKLVGNDNKYEFEHLFESQVESHNRDWARTHGAYVFAKYTQLGSLADLFLELQTACEKTGVYPVFESKIEACIGGVPLLGKPDLFFNLPASETWPQGVRIVFDWKVNGYCSKNAPSPTPGYVQIRGGRTSGSCHKEALVSRRGGIKLNTAGYFETRNPGWASQLAIYSWVLDPTAPVGGTDLPVAVDQLVCNRIDPDLDTKLVEIRVAEHRMLISRQYQIQLISDIKEVWRKLQAGEFLPVGDSEMLELKAARQKEVSQTGTDNDRLLAELGRPKYFGK